MRRRKQNLTSRLKHRITIEMPEEVTDEVGGLTVTWRCFAQVWAEITPRRGREVLEDQRLSTEQSFTITTRYIAGLTTTMRIRYGARVFNIRSIINVDEADAMLEIVAEEGVAV